VARNYCSLYPDEITKLQSFEMPFSPAASSIIIPNYNNGAIPGRAIRSALAQPLEAAHIIVIDNFALLAQGRSCSGNASQGAAIGIGGDR
jgi:hypothetical protein